MMRARGWILTRSGERFVVPEPVLNDEEIFWPLEMPLVKPGQPYPMIRSEDAYRRHQLEGYNVIIYLPIEMDLEDLPKETIEEILGEA